MRGREATAAIPLLCYLSFGFWSMCRAFEISDCAFRVGFANAFGAFLAAKRLKKKDAFAGSNVGKFTSVNLGCDMSKSTCDLVPGTNATIEIDFTVERDVSKVTAVVHGIVMDVPIPFPLGNADACEAADSDVACPLNKGGPYHYKNTLLVHKSYPKMAVTVKWQLKDENDQDIVCALIPARIIK